MKNINVENKERYTAIYFAGDEVGAIYVGVKNTEGKPFNLVIFRKSQGSIVSPIVLILLIVGSIIFTLIGLIII